MMTAVLNSACSRSIRSMICACTVTSSAVVGSSAMSSFGVERQRHGDHRALAHAAGELVRVVVHATVRLRDADQPEQVDGPLGRRLLGDVLVRLDHLDDLPADLVLRMQAGQRVLEDHADLGATDLAQLLVAHLQQVFALEQRRAADLGAPRKPHDGLGADALAGAGLPHDAERLTGVEAEGDPERPGRLRPRSGTRPAGRSRLAASSTPRCGRADGPGLGGDSGTPVRLGQGAVGRRTELSETC